MNPTKPLSLFLKRLVEKQTLTSKVAERFNRLATFELQRQASDAWPDATDQAAKDLCDRIENPQGTVLYDRRSSDKAAAEPEPSKSELAEAFRDDVLARYLPLHGEPGWVIRNWIRTWWQAHSKSRWMKWVVGSGLVWFLWAPALWLVSRPLHWAHHLLSQTDTAAAVPKETLLADRAEPTPPAPAAIEPTAPPAPVSKPALPPHRPAAAKPEAPQPTAAAPAAEPAVHQPEPAPAAPAKKKTFIKTFTTQLLKNADTTIVSAVPLYPVAEGINAAKNAALTAKDETATDETETRGIGEPAKTVAGQLPVSPAHPIPVSRPTPAIPAPTGVRAEIHGPTRITLRWTAVAKGSTYNVYSSASPDMTSPHKENTAPLRTSGAIWDPESDQERYWVAVTTIGDDGKESAYSQAIEVVRKGFTR